MSESEKKGFWSSLFGKKEASCCSVRIEEEREADTGGCSCGGHCSGQKTGIKIQILGTGCPKCKKLTEVAEKAATEMGLAFEIEKVTDINKIVTFKVMSTPAMAVDGKVKIAGKIPTVEEMKELLK